MRFSIHTEERINKRLRGQMRLSKKKVNHIKKKILRAGCVYPWVYQAIRIEKLDKKVKLNRKTESSFGWGDELWAIVKNNVVVTTMFRNSNKPNTPEHFDGEVKLIWSLV